jgi:DNA mismatch repair protein MutS
MELEECPPDRLGAALARLGASELVVPEGWELPDRPQRCHRKPARDFESDGGEARLKAIHGSPRSTASASSAGPMLAAAGGLIAYLDHVGRGALPLLLPPVARRAKRTSPWTRRPAPAWKSSSRSRAGGAAA